MTTDSRASAIWILLLLDLVFFLAAIWLSTHGTAEQVDDKVWEAFTAVNGALLIALRVDSSSHVPPPPSIIPNPTTPDKPAQPPKQ